MPRSKNFDANEHLAQALSALDVQIQELQATRTQLAALIGGGKTTTKAATKATAKAAGKSKGTRTMSDEARQKISVAQKQRWADAKNAAKKKK